MKMKRGDRLQCFKCFFHDWSKVIEKEIFLLANILFRTVNGRTRSGRMEVLQ